MCYIFIDSHFEKFYTDMIEIFLIKKCIYNEQQATFEKKNEAVLKQLRKHHSKL